MALKDGIFRSEFKGLGENNIPIYDRAVDERYFDKRYGEFISNGVFPNGFIVKSNNDMSVSITPGSIYINNKYAYDENSANIKIEPSGTQNRTDRVVFRLDVVNRKITLELKKGKDTLNLYDPAKIERNADIYEMAIADIQVRAGAKKITQADITDLRSNKELCGMVFNPLQEIDTTYLYDQIKSDLNNFRAESQKGFSEWFAGIKGILNEEAAGNLQNLINDLDDKKLDKVGGTVSGDLNVTGNLENKGKKVITTDGGTITGTTNFTGDLQKSGEKVITTTGGTITGTTNFTGKLQKSGKNVISENVSLYYPVLHNTYEMGDNSYFKKMGNIVFFKLVILPRRMNVHSGANYILNSIPMPEELRPKDRWNYVGSISGGYINSILHYTSNVWIGSDGYIGMNIQNNHTFADGSAFLYASGSYIIDDQF